MSQNVSAASELCSTLVELLQFRALHQADKCAYTFLAEGEREESHLTYRELDRRARALAVKLQSFDPKGERAILLYPPGLEFIVGLLGCLYAGVVAVPSYPPRSNRSISRLQANLADAQASIALTTTSILSNIASRFPNVPELVSLRWLATNAVDENLSDVWRDPDVSADTLAVLQYTSGSTASPKGVMVSHGNILHNEQMIREAFAHTENTIFVSWLPLFHDMGLFGQALQSLYAGGTCVLMSPLAFLQRPISWLRAITRYRATAAGGPNFGYDLCVRKITADEKRGLDLSSWALAFNGAEPVRHKTLEEFTTAFGACGFRREAFYPCYGLAEGTLFVSGGEKDSAPSLAPRPTEADGNRLLVGCGHTWMGQKVRIVDPVSYSPRGHLEVGEIWVSGPSVAQGYWNRPEETELTFRASLAGSHQGPFLRTGDLGFLKDGELFLTGRLKDLIIIRGRNIYPQDIEQTVETCHPALRPGCGGAFSVEVGDEERLVVVQEVDARRCANLNEVVGAIRQAVSEEHEVPLQDVVLIRRGTFPKTSSGKLQRRACRDEFLACSLSGILAWRGMSVSGVSDTQFIEDTAGS